MAIHPRAIVDSQAQVDSSAEIGPYAVIEGPVRIGPGTRVYPHTYLTGWTTIGANCEVHPTAVVGHLPQDYHFTGERSYCRIGEGTVIREGVSIHRGSQPESSTIIGARCLLMACSHAGHNCELGEEVTLMNGVLLAGHVQVGSHAIISGNVAVHQFVRIGELAMIGGLTKVTMDAPPFMTVAGEDECVGVNLVGLRRRGYDAAARSELREAYRRLYRSGRPFRESVAALAERVQTAAGRRLVEFLQSESKRGICGGRAGRGGQRAGASTAATEAEG